MTMPGHPNGSAHSDDQNFELVERVAHLAIELLEAARELGDGAIIASAEISAHRAAVILAGTINAKVDRA